MATKTTTVTIPLLGGLGNQLFELAAGLLVGQRMSPAGVAFSDYWLRNPAAGETPRSLGLTGLLHADELVGECVDRSGGRLERLSNRNVIERGPDDDALARVTQRTRVVAGYFQRLSYVEEAWPLLRERLAASEHPIHQALARPDRRPYGALHYRLGDYLTNPQAKRHHGVTAPHYFSSVIREHAPRICEWMVVSDEPEVAVELLRSTSLPAHVRLVVPQGDGEWRDLLTLASGRVCAMSNSSFSWWAAFFGSRVGELQVVAPRPWFSHPALAEPKLFPQTWQRRDRSLVDSG